MTKTRIIGIAVGMLAIVTNAFAEEPNPSKILEQVQRAYEAMQTYKAEGIIALDAEANGITVRGETSFSILLQKPNRYLISWTQKNIPMAGMAQPGAVWSDGTQPYLYMGIMNGYAKIGSDLMAIGSATGISGGAAHTIPALFLAAFKEHRDSAFRLADPKIEKIEKVAADDCYVISGSSAISKREVFWVSKRGYSIRKYRRSLEPPEGGWKSPVTTGNQVEEALKGMGQEVTPQSKKRMAEIMERSAKMLKTMKMKGSSTEVYTSVSSPELSEKDFRFTLPASAVLKTSLFGVALSGAKDGFIMRMDFDQRSPRTPAPPRSPWGMNDEHRFPQTPQGRLDKAAKALASAANDLERFYALGEAATQSFAVGKIDDARKHAQELLALAKKFPTDWNYGNAIHDGNLVLGRIALKEGKTAAAKQYLLAAGRSPGSPQMDSFGPNMSLARDLLEKGERETVLQYFELCRKFWKMGHDRLDQWTKDVKAGQAPAFGANLLY